MHQAVTVWFTGYPASGKSTTALEVAVQIRRLGRSVQVLDADLVRRDFWPELGHSKADRDLNVLRFGRLASLFAEHGVISLVAAISPYREAREAVRKLAQPFVEVHMDAPVEVCAARDPKGLYLKALAGELKGLTGVDDPYEAPLEPDLRLDTGRISKPECARQVVETLRRLGHL